jgi:imidazolonepropionase
MGLEKSHGTISIGKKANLIITEPLGEPGEMMYSFGRNMVERVILGS